ncbi:MAG: nitroreductase family protein, partial [Pontimonas sp.]
DEQLGSLLEAARWSASSGNSQPWRLFVAKRGTPLWDLVVATLAAGNQTWATHASVLIVNVAKVLTDEGADEKWAVYDIGQAAAHLSIQATHMGLIVHQMGGFDKVALRDILDLDEAHQPWVVLAVGYQGDATLLPEKLQEREKNPRVRKPVEEIAPGWSH